MDKTQSRMLLSRLPRGAADFIGHIVKRIRYRRKVRQEVLAELANHFEDELKDCAGAQEREEKARRLIEEFGDVELLAALLRRAKKRCRPFWRSAVARVLQVAAVLAICFVVYVAWHFTGQPVITTNYLAQLNDLVRPPADATQNAAPLYFEAARLSETTWHDDTEPESKGRGDETFEEWKLREQGIPWLLGKKFEEVTPEHKKRIEDWLNTNEEILAMIVAGTQRPYCWPTYRSTSGRSMFDLQLPPLSELRKLARALRWRAWLRAEKGQFEEAFTDAKSCYRLGQHLRGDKTLIEQLVGVAIEALSMRTVRDIVSEHKMDAAVLASFQRDLEQIVADEDFAVSFKAERLCAYDEIQRGFTEGRIGKGHLYVPRLRERGGMPYDYDDEDDLVSRAIVVPLFELIVVGPHLLRHPNKQDTLRSAKEAFDYFERLAARTTARRHAEEGSVDEQILELLGDNMFLHLIVPATARIAEISDRVRADVGATITILAALRHRQDKGEYPKNLNQLMDAGYLQKLPVDPFSDEPLAYSQTDDSFTVYSWGENCSDDGGRVSRDRKGRPKMWWGEGDAVFWPLPEPQVKREQI